MRILFVTPELPNRLHRVRALNLLRGLGRGHEVDLISLAHQPPPAAVVAEVTPWCRRVDWVLQPRWRSLAAASWGLLGPVPLEACYERSPALARVIAERLAQRSYDVVYIKRLRMAQYAPPGRDLPRVLDLTDSMSRFYDQGWRRAPWPAKALFLEEWLKHRAYEPAQVARFDRCLVASPVDADYLRRSYGLNNVVVVPNPVDTDYFQPRAEPASSGVFVLSGLMDKLVNVDAAHYACTAIWPHVRRRLPEARLRLVGPRPSRSVRALCGRDGVAVVGFAPDLREEVARATAVLVPLRVGTGTKNKVLQALAMARPVVTTSVGNEGLDAVSGEHLLVADDAEAFAAALVRLAESPAERRALGEAGRAWVTERYGLPGVMARLEQVLAQVAGVPAAR